MSGNKAKNLYVLQKNGIKVPEFLVQKEFSNITSLESIHLKIPLILRSSFSCEDSIMYTFAWIFESYAPIYDTKSLVKGINKCTRDTNDKYQQYMYFHSLQESVIDKNYILQEFIIGDFSGVCFTSYNKNECYFEIVPGLNIPLVQWNVHTPFSFSIHKISWKVEIYNFYWDLKYCGIKNNHIVNKTYEGLFFEEDILVKHAWKLYNLCIKVEEIFHSPQDIEFTVKDNDIYILQSRNIT